MQRLLSTTAALRTPLRSSASARLQHISRSLTMSSSSNSNITLYTFVRRAIQLGRYAMVLTSLSTRVPRTVSRCVVLVKGAALCGDPDSRGVANRPVSRLRNSVYRTRRRSSTSARTLRKSNGSWTVSLLLPSPHAGTDAYGSPVNPNGVSLHRYI